MLKIFLYVVPIKLRDEALDVLAVLELLRIGWLLLDRADLGVEVCDIEEVGTTSAVLELLSMETRDRCPRPTFPSSYRSSSVICRVTPGATSIVRRARGLTLSSASAAVAQAAARMAEENFIVARKTSEASY